MKEKLTLRNVVILSAAFLGLLFFCLSFAAKSYLNVNEDGYMMSYRFLNVVVAFALKNEKAKKFALIGAGVLAVIGGVFIFFGGETGPRSLLYAEIGSLDNIGYWEGVLKGNGHTWGLRGLGVTIGVFAILVGCAFGASPFLPEKKLGK